MIQLFVQYFVLITWILGCETQKVNPARPTEEVEEIGGYFDSAESEVSIESESEVSIAGTKLDIRANSARSNFNVRLSRLSALPEMTPDEAAVLSDVNGDVVEIKIYDPNSGKILSSEDLLLPYRFEQKISHPGSSISNLGLMVISDPGTTNEKRVLVPQSELSIIQNAAMAFTAMESIATVAIDFKLTSAIVWLVMYTDEALELLESSTAEKLFSVGGGNIAPITIGNLSFDDASIKINQDDAYTSTAEVRIQTTAPDAADMYLTNTPGCAAGGEWRPIAESTDWTLSGLNMVSRVYVKFRSSDGRSSSCLSDSIIHDDEAPESPAYLSVSSSTSSLSSSPTFSWEAANDSGSGISRYEIAIGSNAGSNDVHEWVSVGTVLSNSIRRLNLIDQVEYFPSIRSVDNAGNKSLFRAGSGWIASQQACSTLTYYRGSSMVSSSLVSYGSDGMRRQFLQALDGTLYVIAKQHNTNFPYILSSADGGQTWSEIGSKAEGIYQMKAAIDSNEVIHLYYSLSSNGHQYYRTYTPSNDTWSLATSIYSDSNYRFIGGIDVDADGKVYILTQTSSNLSYRVKTSAGWQSAVELDAVGYGSQTEGSGSILVDSSGSIHVLAIMNSPNNLYYWKIGSITKELISSGPLADVSMTLDQFNDAHFVYAKDFPPDIFYRSRTSDSLQAATTLVSGAKAYDLHISIGKDGYISIVRGDSLDWESNAYTYLYQHANSSGSWVQSTLASNTIESWDMFTSLLKPQFHLGVGIPQSGIALLHNALNENQRLTYLGTSTLAYPSTCP